MDEVDLNFKNYDELFGVTMNNSEELFENGGIDSLFGAKDMSGADSNCEGAAAAAEVILPPLCKTEILQNQNICQIWVNYTNIP